MSSQVRLKLLPSARCLFDDLLQLKVSGLRSRQVVALKAKSTDDKGVEFNSTATYRADGLGELDLHRDSSLSGSYVGIEPMGLLWSMKTDRPHQRFQKTNSLKPNLVRFSVHEVEGQGPGEGRTLAEGVAERLLMADGVNRQQVKVGNVRGVLFTPPGPGPYPAVLDLYTFGGGLSEKRAALLASRGFVVLTVALYGIDDMPKNISEIHLDYFEEAIEFLRKQDKVGSKGVGLTSLSKSGDLVLSIASFLPNISATVWINGCSANIGFPLYYKKKLLLPPLNCDVSRVISTESGAFITTDAIPDPTAEENRALLIPIQNATGRFLFVASDDDNNWDSQAFVEEMTQRLRHHGKENFEVLICAGAGHYLEPPYGPYCASSFHGVLGKPVLWGGQAKTHAAAEVQLWKKIQEFLKAHVSCESTVEKAKL